MSRSFILGAAVTLSLLASPVVAQDTGAPPRVGSGPMSSGPMSSVIPAVAPATAAGLTAEEAEQLIFTLRTRNEQLRYLTEQMRELETTAAGATALTLELANSRQALLIAAQRNADLVAIGEEIIADYERMNLGDRAANGEPLTGLFRVRLENKLQEFQSQIAALGFYPQKELDALEAAQAAGNP